MASSPSDVAETNDQVTSAEAQLCASETALKEATAMIEHLRRDLDQAQAESMEATERTQTAEYKVVELEHGLLAAEREYALFKDRAESRLEIIRVAHEQEEREGATQVKST